MPRKSTKIDGSLINRGVGLGHNPATGETFVDINGVKTAIGIGELGKLNSATVERGGTGGGTAENARANLGIGTASEYNIGTAEGNIPIIGVGGALAATSFKTGLTSELTDAALKLNGDDVVVTAVTLGLVKPEPLAVGADLDAAKAKIDELVTFINNIYDALTVHHKLIK